MKRKLLEVQAAALAVRLWWFPWSISHRARRIMGLAGAAWLAFMLLAIGVIDGANRWTPTLVLGACADFVVGIFLVWQMPARSCKQCGGAA